MGNMKCKAVASRLARARTGEYNGHKYLLSHVIKIVIKRYPDELSLQLLFKSSRAGAIGWGPRRSELLVSD